ncbi:MAG: hypothetical protein NTZ05_15915 [Chloroflexi bacterium]|nr:hypothetical protein [Chloroflexota bacterium]
MREYTDREVINLYGVWCREYCGVRFKMPTTPTEVERFRYWLRWYWEQLERKPLEVYEAVMVRMFRQQEAGDLAVGQ